jgi:hypothetical protein
MARALVRASRVGSDVGAGGADGGGAPRHNSEVIQIPDDDDDDDIIVIQDTDDDFKYSAPAPVCKTRGTSQVEVTQSQDEQGSQSLSQMAIFPGGGRPIASGLSGSQKLAGGFVKGESVCVFTPTRSQIS